MTSAVLDRDVARWDAHASVAKFSAADERDVTHALFPMRARLVDVAERHGQLARVPALLLPRHVEKADFERFGVEPFEIVERHGNLLTTAGLTRLMSLLIGGGGQAYDHTHTALGVGDTSTAATIADVDLNAVVNIANRYFQVADATYPQVALGVMTLVATFPSGVANFTWNEWGVAQNVASGANAATAPLLNHKIVNLGTKTSAAAWALTITVTIA